MIVWLITSTCLLFGTHFHNLGHTCPRSAFVRIAQKMHLVISPQHHWVHHSDGQIVRYCVINGWANLVCDPLRVWRGLEWLVKMLTGAIPRRDDLEWQLRYGRTGTLIRTSQIEPNLHGGVRTDQDFAKETALLRRADSAGSGLLEDKLRGLNTLLVGLMRRK